MAKTYEELLEQAAIIRDETAAGKNTATRVGGTITEAVEYVKELKDTYAGIHAEAAAAKQAAAAANTKNAEQDGKISSLEAKDATHDTKIAKLEERVLQYLYQKIYQLNEGAGARVFHGFTKATGEGGLIITKDTYRYSVLYSTTQKQFVLNVTDEASGAGVRIGTFTFWPEIILPNGSRIASSESYALRDCLYYIYVEGDGSTYYYIDSNGVASEKSATYLLRRLVDKNASSIAAASGTANDAKATADAAKATADAAKLTAEEAKTNAGSARSVAQSALLNATAAQSTATEVNTKITELSLCLGKTGVISQVQSWKQAADKGYDYVINGIVRGVIPQANIDLFTSAGAIFNEGSGYFELNGLTDISYEEMIKIYNAYNPNPWNGQQGMLIVQNTRTFLPASNDIILSSSFSGLRLCYSLSYIETINMLSTTDKFQFNNLQLAWFFNYRLKSIQNIIDCRKVNNYSQAFEKCYSLVDVRLWKIIESVSFQDCARLSNNSILYMINNEAATSPITITLHADVYNRCMANEDILAALEAHTNISLASA